MAADRMILCDPAHVGVVRQVIKVLSLDSTVDVCAWQSGPEGMVAYVNADYIRQLVQTGARDEA